MKYFRMISLVLVLAFTLCGCVQPDKTLTVITVVDTSASTAPIHSQIDSWLYQLLMRVGNPNAHFTLMTEESKCEIVYEVTQLPTLEQLKDSGAKAKIDVCDRQFTRPGAAMVTIIDYMKSHPGQHFIIAFFTDGENDFEDDKADLSATSKYLLSQTNVDGIGVFGSDNNLRSSSFVSDFGASNQEKICIRGGNDVSDGIAVLTGMIKTPGGSK